uniref:Uncharacterized protein n=1 Tax=Glossina palpalis gambiensis TaxID=67801 RepID=A0A1B0ARH9_9MUSC
MRSLVSVRLQMYYTIYVTYLHLQPLASFTCKHLLREKMRSYRMQQDCYSAIIIKPVCRFNDEKLVAFLVKSS